MKLTTALAAGLALGLLAAAPAAAQDRHDQNMTGDRHDQNKRGDRHDDGMRGDRDRGWGDHRNNGNHNGWRNNRHCRWTMRHHRRMRVCW
ncbi:MAG: hypothetical protein JWO81_3059 [Alphaproteobacteria bacterium]|nr:hypothetical protein [Alphaproteobacteria bacterium]